MAATMVRRPGRALAATYVRPSPKGRYQVRVRDASSGRDVKVTAPTLASAVEAAREKAERP